MGTLRRENAEHAPERDLRDVPGELNASHSRDIKRIY